MNKEQTLFFTGHRDVYRTEGSEAFELLRATVRSFIERGYLFFVTGGALGFDTMAAETVLHLQETDLPHVRLLLAIPCEGQDKSWPEADKGRYAHIKSRAHADTVLSDHYFTGCMQARNRYMVDRASVCVCYMTKTSGGTAGTVRYAESKGLPVVNLA